jgi:hypothetical protein
MRTRLPLLGLLGLLGLLLASTAAGCDLYRAVQPSSAMLVRVEASGGECPGGECANRWDILRDGRVISADGAVPDVTPEVLARIILVVDATDWRAILARPFMGECPKNFDGQEFVYTFPKATGDVVVASCTTRIDPGDEPFASIQTALFAPGG